MSEYEDFEAMWGGAEAEVPTDKETRNPLPVGKYEAVVRGLKVKDWDDGGKSIDWEFQVCGGEFDGRLTWMNAGTNTLKKLKRTKGHFVLFGLDPNDFPKVVAAFPTLVGRCVKISVSEYDGKLYTHLNALADAPPAQAAPVTAPAATQAALPGIPAQTTTPFD